MKAELRVVGNTKGRAKIQGLRASLNLLCGKLCHSSRFRFCPTPKTAVVSLLNVG